MLLKGWIRMQAIMTPEKKPNHTVDHISSQIEALRRRHIGTADFEPNRHADVAGRVAETFKKRSGG